MAGTPLGAATMCSEAGGPLTDEAPASGTPRPRCQSARDSSRQAPVESGACGGAASAVWPASHVCLQIYVISGTSGKGGSRLARWHGGVLGLSRLRGQDRLPRTYAHMGVHHMNARFAETLRRLITKGALSGAALKTDLRLPPHPRPPRERHSPERRHHDRILTRCPDDEPDGAGDLDPRRVTTSLGLLHGSLFPESACGT